MCTLTVWDVIQTLKEQSDIFGKYAYWLFLPDLDAKVETKLMLPSKKLVACGYNMGSRVHNMLGIQVVKS